MHHDSTRISTVGKPGNPQHATNGCQTGVKPAKPYPDFPLFPHASKRWAKKIWGELHYFGSWAAGPDAALEKYLSQKDDLYARRKPREAAGTITVKVVVNAFLNAKLAAKEAGEITSRTFRDYNEATDLIIDHFGKSRLASDLRPDDFASLRKVMAKRWGHVRLGNVIVRVRAVFKHASENDLLDRPISFGSAFKRPSKKTIRIDRAKKGVNLFTREEILSMLEATDGQLHAMILLGINCAFGNADCGTLPIAAVDLDAGMIDFPRPKTGIARRVHLWPETIEAIRHALASRPAPKKDEHAGLLFITKYGGPWHVDTPDSPVSRETGKVLRELGINGRERLGFYTLRHVFRTVADETLDRVAIDIIMGHTDPSMGANYRERVGDERLRRVVEHVRGWLFAKEGGEK
jgi:integrase